MLLDAIRNNPFNENRGATLKNLIQTSFFEKYRLIKGVSPEELMDFKKKDRIRLRQIIGDEEIADWILDVKKRGRKKEYDSSKKYRIGKKEKYLMDINSILDKMEAWGK